MHLSKLTAQVKKPGVKKTASFSEIVIVIKLTEVSLIVADKNEMEFKWIRQLNNTYPDQAKQFQKPNL
ncbi:MAG: hypothetical protein K0B06_12220 [Brevefilum sp.]|nr:hypothetical protein [Brevefilum sp.]